MKQKGFILMIMLFLLLLLAVTSISLNMKAGMQAKMAVNQSLDVQTYFDHLAVIEASLWKLAGDPTWRSPSGGSFPYNGKTYTRKVVNPDAVTYPALIPYKDAVIVSVTAPNATRPVSQSFRYQIATPFLIRTPRQVCIDSLGNIFFADQDNHTAWKISALTGAITPVAGNGTSGYSGDGGPATQAQLNSPRGIAIDSQGNVYIGTVGDDRVRKVTAGGSISTVVNTAGSGGLWGDGGQATAARIRNPYGLGVDSSRNIYIADTDNHRIRKVTVATGIITTVAGTSGGLDGDGGQATAAKLNKPRSVFVDAAGDMYIADTDNHRIRKVTVATGIITTIAGTSSGYSGDGGAATAAQLNNPEDVFVNTAGSIYIADRDNHRIRKVTAGTISTIAGTGTAGYSGDGGAATAAMIDTPRGLALTGTGEVIIADTGNSCLRQVQATIMSTLPMTTGPGLSSPAGAASSYDAVQKRLFLYVADMNNHRIRKLDTLTNAITTVAGTGSAGSAGDGGPATSAALNAPEAVALDSQANIYIADTGNNKIRKVTAATGVIETVAGTGVGDSSGDGGTATLAKIDHPGGVYVTASGTIYLADTGRHRIRRVTGGIIYAVSGTAVGFWGDGTDAGSGVKFNGPQGLWVDAAGNLFIADTGNHAIRKITAATNIINTVAGIGTSSGYSGDGGAATAAQLRNPQRVSVDAAGNIYIADTGNHATRIVNHDATPLITTLAGTGTSGFNGDDKPAVQARLNSPRGIALGLNRGAGRIFISDSGNNRIRVLYLKAAKELYGP